MDKALVFSLIVLLASGLPALGDATRTAEYNVIVGTSLTHHFAPYVSTDLGIAIALDLSPEAVLAIAKGTKLNIPIVAKKNIREKQNGSFAYKNVEEVHLIHLGKLTYLDKRNVRLEFTDYVSPAGAEDWVYFLRKDSSGVWKVMRRELKTVS